jgi:hypothetical protein
MRANKWGGAVQLALAKTCTHPRQLHSLLATVHPRVGASTHVMLTHARAWPCRHAAIVTCGVGWVGHGTPKPASQPPISNRQQKNNPLTHHTSKTQHLVWCDASVQAPASPTPAHARANVHVEAKNCDVCTRVDIGATAHVISHHHSPLLQPLSETKT